MLPARVRSAALSSAALLLAAPAVLADHPTAGVAGGGAGPINTASAVTLPQGLFAFTLGAEFIDIDRLSDQELTDFAEKDQDVDSADWELVPYMAAAYGVSDDLMVGARLPWVVIDDIRESSTEGGMPGVDDEGSVSGLGDVTLFTQYRVLHDAPSRFDLAVIAGVKAPTGETHEHSDSGELLEADHQPGSGSWDPLVGVVATESWGRSTVSAELLYTHANTGDQSTNLGDVVTYNLGWSYHVGGPEPHEHSHAPGTAPHSHAPAEAAEGEHVPGDLGWDAVLELNGFNREERTVSGVRNDNSGGNRLFLSPGVRVPVNERSSFFASVGVPLFEHLNGAEHKTDYRSVVGWSFAY